MVTVAEAHDVAIVPPWYAPAPRKVAIHRYLDAGFVAQYQADASNAPQNNPTLFGWEQEDTMPASQGSLLNVRIPAAGAALGHVALRVEDCSKHDGRWTVRYAFVTPPPPEVLTLFGLPDTRGVRDEG